MAQMRGNSVIYRGLGKYTSFLVNKSRYSHIDVLTNHDVKKGIPY